MKLNVVRLVRLSYYFPVYFSVYLVLVQFCLSYCYGIGSCASLNKIDQQKQQFSDNNNQNLAVDEISYDNKIVRESSQDKHHLEETLGHDPFVYSWFTNRVHHHVEKIIKELFEKGVDEHKELLQVFLDGLSTTPSNGFMPLGSKGPEHQDDSIREPSTNSDSSHDVPSSAQDYDHLEDRPGIGVPSWDDMEDYLCNKDDNEENHGQPELFPATTDSYNLDPIPEHPETDPPKGCYFYTGDIIYKNYLVCNDSKINEIPSRIPSELDIFEMNSTNVKCIRSNAFSDVQVQFVRLNQNQITSTHKFAFTDVINLKTLSMNRNRLLLPVWFQSYRGLEQLELLELDFNQINMDQVLNIDNGNLYKMLEETNSGENGPFLTSIKYLSLKANQIGFIPSFFFHRFTGTQWLALSINLSNCRLRYIHSDAFTPFKRIYLLDLGENPNLMANLTTASRGLAAVNIQKLGLTYNNLPEIPKEAFEIMNFSLSAVDLKGNSLLQLTDESFPLMLKLKALNLDYCKLSSISSNAFDNLPNLDTLTLKGNVLIQVPAAIGALVNLNQLVLSYNKDERVTKFNIGNGVFANNRKLMSLHLNDLKLRNINARSFEGLIKLKLLHMKNSMLESIEDNTFLNTPSLEFLDMRDNAIRVLTSNTFLGLDNLDSLYLPNCGITFPASRELSHNPAKQKKQRYKKAIYQNSTSEKEDKPRHLQNPTIDFFTLGQTLKTLLVNAQDDDEDDYDDVEIASLREPFKHLKRLRYLFLSDNKITDLYKELFEHMPYLHYLDLNRNSIQMWTTPLFENNTLLQELYLSSNPLLTVTDEMLMDFEQVHTNIDLTDNPFICDIGICNLKSYVSNKTFYLTDWHHAPQRYQCFMLEQSTRVQIIKLTDEYCEGLDTNLTETETPSASTTTTEESQLKGGGDSGLNGSFSIKTIAIISSCLLFVICGSVLFYKKRVHLKYFWFNFKLNFMKGKDARLIRNNSNSSSSNVGVGCDNAVEFKYDVFISYNHSDSEFIQDNLVPILEGNGKFLSATDNNNSNNNNNNGISCESTKQIEYSTHYLPPPPNNNKLSPTPFIEASCNNINCKNDDTKFKVCLHVRDFEVGTSITENIIDCVDHSRKVVIVVSKKYLESQWCLFEMNLAYHRLLEVRRKSFLVILLEEIPPEYRTKVLNYLMKSTTYLAWPGNKASTQDKKLFWSRLKHSLKNN